MALTLPKTFGEFVAGHEAAFPALSMQLAYHAYVYMRQQRDWRDVRLLDAPLAGFPDSAPVVGLNPAAKRVEVVLTLEPHVGVSMHRISQAFGAIEAASAAMVAAGAEPCATDSFLAATVDSDSTISMYRFHRAIVAPRSQGDAAAEAEQKQQAELARAAAARTQ